LPRRANSSTIPAPIPSAAPVTMAVLGRLLMVSYLESGRG
jgi:hypothetical protein